MAGLPDEVFERTQGRAHLIEQGVTSHELRGPLWHRAAHGWYRFMDASADDPDSRIDMARCVMPPDGALTGWAAAYLHGTKDFDGRSWDGCLEPVVVALPRNRRIKRAGIATIRAPLPEQDITTIGGINVTTAPRTCFELMRRGSLEDAVVAVDAMLRAGAVKLDELRTYVDGKARWDGVPAARAALELVDGRAASCPESRLRVVWVVEAKLPRPKVNVPVFGPSGHLAGVPDLLDEETGLAGEYDGAHHRGLEQHAADNVREERLEALGLTVVRATSVDLRRGRRQLVARLREGYRRASRASRRWHT
jgi:hypothetical protein